VDDNGSVVIQGTVNSIKSQVDFINSRVISIPDTGVILEVAPFVLIMVLAAGCGLIYVANKRKEER
jgi:hypothetical protein